MREGLDETLTVRGLGLSERLQRSLATTNAIESLLSRTHHVQRHVKRWRGGTMVLRWVVAGVLEAAKGFRRVQGCQDMPALVAALCPPGTRRAVRTRGVVRAGCVVVHQAAAEFQQRTGHPLTHCLISSIVAIGCGHGSTAPTAPSQATIEMFRDANAIIAQCPTPAEVAASDLDLTLIFESDPTIGQVVCYTEQSSRDLTLLQAQVYRVLTVMRQLVFDAPLPWTSDSLYGWFVSSIRGIRLRGDRGTSFCCEPGGIINIQTQNLAALRYPSDFQYVGKLMVLFVHEARHNNGFPHTCFVDLGTGLRPETRISRNQEELAGVVPGSNDDTIDQLGAWGVQYYTDLFLGSHSDPALITSTMQAAFLRDAQIICNTRFCQDNCP